MATKDKQQLAKDNFAEIRAMNNPTFGVLLTGYLWKQTARTMTRNWERRFLVLTKVGLHWFRRTDGYDLFGEETGNVGLGDIKDVSPNQETMLASYARKLAHDDGASTPPPGASANDRSLGESEGVVRAAAATTTEADPLVTVFSFVVKSRDGYVRTFRCSSLSERDRWIEAITMAQAAFEHDTHVKEELKAALSAAAAGGGTADERLFAQQAVQRKMSLRDIDFAPINAAARAPPADGAAVDFAPLPQYLYHSVYGGSCYGGAAPPLPTVVLAGGRSVASSADMLDAPWGDANRVTVSFRTGAGAETDAEHDAPPVQGEGVQIFLSNGGRSEITLAALAEMAADHAAAEKDKKTPQVTNIACTGMRYPGGPSIMARIEVNARLISDELIPASAESAAAGEASFNLSLANIGKVPKALRFKAFAAVQPLFVAIAPKIGAHFSTSTGGTAPAVSAALLVLLGLQMAVYYVLFTWYELRYPKLDKSKTYELVLRSYCEAISDGPQKDDSATKWPVPTRFINGTKTDPPGTAEKRWAATMKWRKAEKIDTAILQPHPHYETIKRCYPHFYGRKDNTGTQLCYFERPGFLELETLGKIGVPAMVRHYVFQIEFCWTYMAPSEEIRTLSGVDVQNVGLYDLKGIVKEFLGAISKVSQEHYPERAGKICVLNAPGWFSMLWSIIKLGLHPNTQKKVFIMSASEIESTMKKVINEGDLPFEYGGTLKYVHGESASTNGGVWEGPLGPEKEAARWCSEVEVAIADFVKRLNSKSKLPLPPELAWKREDITITKGDFLKTYEPGWEEHESELHLPREQWRPDRWPGMLFVKK